LRVRTKKRISKSPKLIISCNCCSLLWISTRQQSIDKRKIPLSSLFTSLQQSSG
jgi:hypothetical protein